MSFLRRLPVTATWRAEDDITIEDLAKLTMKHLDKCAVCQKISDEEDRIGIAAEHAAEELMVSTPNHSHFELELSDDAIEALVLLCVPARPIEEEMATLDPDDLALQHHVAEILRRRGVPTWDTEETLSWTRRIQNRELNPANPPVLVHAGQLRIA
jgi:hypothetical protein